jgi:GDP-mannose 6-dehydrogenase
MKIGIFGLGYVGMTTAACLVQRGFEVVGFEVEDVKRAELEAGRCPLSEPGVGPVLGMATKSGLFSVQRDIEPGDIPDVLLVCVGIGTCADGTSDVSAVRTVFARLESLLQSGVELDADVGLRSAVPPGTLKRLVLEFPKVFNQVPVVYYPEFLREGCAMHDFNHPPQTLLGQVEGGLPPRCLPHLMAALGFEYETVPVGIAETLKFACNAFHAVKVAFANEVGRFATSVGVDGREVMRLLCQDTFLNLSPRYLQPGSPYGGPCLPRDTRSMVAQGRSLGLELPLMASADSSNQQHLDYLADRIMDSRPETVCVLGLAFKRDTDDVRESAGLGLVEQLAREHEVHVLVHDFEVRPDRLIGPNQRVMERVLGLANVRFESDPAKAAQRADVVVIMHRDERYLSQQFSREVRVLRVAEWMGV